MFLNIYIYYAEIWGKDFFPLKLYPHNTYKAVLYVYIVKLNTMI